MIRDFDNICTWMYVLISDLFVSMALLAARLGSEPACTDAERITMAIVGECYGWDQESSVAESSSATLLRPVGDVRLEGGRTTFGHCRSKKRATFD